MKASEMKEIILSLSIDGVSSLYSTSQLSDILSRSVETKDLKKIDLEIFEHFEKINNENVRPDRELQLQYVLIVLKNMLGEHEYHNYDAASFNLSLLQKLPKELIANQQFLNKFINFIIEVTDQEISYLDQYATLPLGLRSNPEIAIHVFDFLSCEHGSKNIDTYLYCMGTDEIAPKLLKDRDFIKKIMKVNPKLFFSDSFPNVVKKFSPKAIKEICNDREFLDEMRQCANSMEYEGASYIFMKADPKIIKLEDVMVALKERAMAVLNRKEIKSRFIGIQEIMDEIDTLDKSDLKNQPFAEWFSLAPKTRLDFENLLDEYR